MNKNNSPTIGSGLPVAGAAPPSALNQRQQRFVEEFLKDFNKTQAAIRAGYSPKSARDSGRQAYANPAVQKEIRVRKRLLSQQVEIDEQDILREQQVIAFSNMADYIEYPEVQEEGKSFIPIFRKITKKLGHCVKSIQVKDTQWGKTITLTLWDKQAALDFLARVKGMLDEDEEKDKPKAPFQVLVMGNKPVFQVYSGKGTKGSDGSGASG